MIIIEKDENLVIPVGINPNISNVRSIQSKTVDSSTVLQSVTPDSGYDGLSSVTVNPYVLDAKTVDPSTSVQVVESSEDALSSVTVNAVTASIDPNIIAGNIRKDVEILGVTGTYEGGTTVEWSDVNFIDYDGTLLYSYTKADFLALSELPANPVHDGLTAEGWNWTIEAAQQYVNKYGILYIGQYYTTTDGMFHMTIEVPEDNWTLQYLYTNEGTIEWGDGETTSVSEYSTASEHTYALAGTYIIKCTCTSVSCNSFYNRLPYSSSNFSRYITHVETSSTTYELVLPDSLNLQTISVSKGSQFSQYTFANCNSLKSTIVDGRHTGEMCYYNCFDLETASFAWNMAQEISVNMFRRCLKLRDITLPSYVDYIYICSPDTYSFAGCVNARTIIAPNVKRNSGYVFNECSNAERIITGLVQTSGSKSCNSTFYECESLKELVLDSVVRIGDYCFYDCLSLETLTIPSTVTYIGETAFNSEVLRDVYLPEVPPAYVTSTSFSNLRNCKFHIPAGTLSTYLATSDWSAYESYFVEDL